MDRLILFVVLSIPVIIVSWRTLFKISSHGFYRFFSWECILWLFVTNYRYWFKYPFTLTQVISWILLIISGYLVIAGVILMKRHGKPGRSKAEKTLYQFEKTTELIDRGIFKYIRHPLYSSLIFLTWGIFFKNMTVELFMVAMISTLCLFITALYDEKACIRFFGDPYIEYMKRSRRFIPFVI